MADAGKSSKGTTMYLTKGSPEMTTVVPTAITPGNPTSVTAPAPTGDVTAYAVGQIVYCRDTGFAALDGKYFTIAEVTAGGFTLLGADTTGSTEVLGGDPEMDVYDAADLLKACLASIAFNLETPGTIQVGTFCNPTATIPATATAVGSMTLVGWIDKDDEAYQEFLKAAEDGLPRVFSVVLAQQQGEIIAPIIVTGVTWDVPLEGAMGFTATANLQQRPRHLF